MKALDHIVLTEWVAEEALSRGYGMKRAEPRSDSGTWLHGREVMPNKSPSLEEVDSWGFCHLKKFEILCWTQETNSQETVALQFIG